MEKAQEKVLQALQLALQMEQEGKQYYQKSIDKCVSKFSKDLLTWLTAEEDKHQEKFKKIYDSVVAEKGWPKIATTPDAGLWLKTTFKESIRAEKPAADCKSDIYIMEKAMELENKTHSLYSERGSAAENDAEKRFYTAIAGEEMAHYLALVNYREYLLDPSSYFVKTERHSLDGG